MANTLTGLIPIIYESLDVVSRELVGFIPNVFRNSSAEQAALNQTITYPVAPAATAQDITAGVTAPNAGDNAFGNGTLTISKSRAVPVRWNGEEQKSSINAGFYQQLLRDQFTQAFRTLTNEMEGDLAATYTKASRAFGTAGTTPFGTAGDMTDFANTFKILKDNGAGTADLKMILNTAAGVNLRGKQSSLFKVNEAGTDDTLRNGNIGRLQGFDIGESAQIKKTTAGSFTGTVTVTGALGATALTATTAAGAAVALVAGDVITLAGDTNKYVVAAAASIGASTSGTITIAAPGLQLAASSAAPTVAASYSANMAFRKGAIHLVTRTPAMPVGPDGKPIDMADDVMEVVDPFTGLAFQIAVYRQFRQILYYVGLAWGASNVKAEHTAILLG